MASIISQAYYQDDLPAIPPPPKILLTESFCRKKLTLYEEYTIFQGPDDVTIDGIGRGRSSRNRWEKAQIEQKPSSQREIIETIRILDSRSSVASKLANLYSNQRKHIDDIVHGKFTKEREIPSKCVVAQLRYNELRNLETRTKETISITVYIKHVPLSGVDVISLYRARVERSASKLVQQRMVTGQDIDQGKQGLVDICKTNLQINSMYDVVPQSYNIRERVGSMSPALAYDSNEQDQLDIPTSSYSSYWTIRDQNELPMLIERYGTDWHGIAKSIGTKTHIMIKNYYQRQIDSGNSDLEEKARIADEKRNQKESAAALPLSVFPAKPPSQVSMQQQRSQQQHNESTHKQLVKKWVCIEPRRGVKDEFRPITPLAKCQACKQNKKYDTYYKATTHIRRAHFMPKRRGRNEASNADDKSEKRGGKGGGTWPPMKELKRWMKGIDVDVSSNVMQQDDYKEPGEDEVLADPDESTNMAAAPLDLMSFYSSYADPLPLDRSPLYLTHDPSNPMSFDHSLVSPAYYSLYPADESKNIASGPSNPMSFDYNPFAHNHDQNSPNFSSFYFADDSRNMASDPLNTMSSYSSYVAPSTLDRSPPYPADDPSNSISFDHRLVSPAHYPLFPSSVDYSLLNPADNIPMSSNPHLDLWPPGLEEQELKYPRIHWDMPGKSNLGELSTGSRSLKEQEPEHSLQESKLKEHSKLTREHIAATDEVVVEGQGPFTDSGYASILKSIPRDDPALSDKQQCPVDDKSDIGMCDNNAEDTKTIYSAATSIDLPHSQQYIVELCSDIFRKLENHFDSTNWNTLEKALPSLIKAFAIKIGYDSSAQVNQDIMYFIHKKHSGIISHLKTMFCCKDDGQPTSGQRGPEGMSLLDKMSMWDNKAGEIDTAAENDELFEGVGDDDDEIADEVGLSKYHGVILQSPSYEWLLSSLRKEFSLQWDSRQPRIMVENIRQKILDKLPTGTISKRRPLRACEVTFSLQLDDTTDRGNRMFGKLVDSEILLPKLITVTGCQRESQALTVEQYMCQTWPTFGLQLLNLLQRVITDSSHCSVDLPGNTQLNARIRGSRLTITAIGPTQFVAECAEQLAWLQAAFFRNSHNQAGYCVPSIEHYRVDTTLSRSRKLKYKGRCDVAVRLIPLENPADTIPQKQSWWQGLLGKNTVIQGFPIYRRPEAYPGLELSFELLLSSVQTEQAIIDDGIVLLRGPTSTLQLLKDTNDVFLWKPFHPRNGVCSCGEHHMEISRNTPYSSFDLRRLKTGRHILGVCKDLLTTMAESSEVMCEKLSLPEAKCVQHYTSTDIRPAGNSQNTACNPNAIDLDKILSVPAETQHDEQDSGSSTTSKVDYSVPKEGLPLYIESPDGPPAADSPSNSTMPSQDESLDSDMLSISDASEQFELPENNAAINAFICDVVNNLLSGFRSTTQCQFSQAASGNGGQSTPTIRPAETGSSSTSGNSGRSGKKRRAADDDDDNADQDGFRKRPNKKPRHDPKNGPQISFACPYLKMDPVKHGKCCAYQLTRIQDVKQHLTRVHTPDRYCQRCLETDFPSEEALDGHLDLNTCLRDGSRSLEGISNKQQRELSRKSKTGIGEEEQWFKIWEILFLTHPRPSSVYMDTELSMELRLFKEYGDTHESDVVGGLYEADPIWSGGSTAEQRRAFVRMVIAQGMRRVFEDYRHSLRSREQSDESIQPARSEAALSSFADSGIVAGSQPSPGEVSSGRHGPSQSPPQDTSSRRHVPSQPPAVFSNGEPGASIPDDENSRRHAPSQIPSQAPPIFDNGGPSAWGPQDESSRRQNPSQTPVVFDNGGLGAWGPQDENSRHQIPSQAPPIFDNGGPSPWMSQDGTMQMSQGVDVDLLTLSNGLFGVDGFDSSGLELDLSNWPK